ncbi:MAG: ABC transporter ATPase [Brumimicrobium sp.]|nr:ABC transporter ATPase [Brumimicrobium sp.]MCO5267909.1 hypothetical protein [Brumimicrobium sp.]
MTHNIFSNYPDLAKIWVYQSARELNPAEESAINEKLIDFTENWDSHGSIVKSEAVILYKRFIVLLADDTEDRLCGSAGDRSLQFFKALDAEFNLSLMDRMIVSYRKGEEILSTNINDFRDLIKSGDVDENTIVFNNVITTKADFENKWEVSIKDSWHKQLIELAV